LPTIVIGTQQWMRENLDVSFFRNGDPIPYISDAGSFWTLITPAWTWYNGNAANGEIYGKLYNWYAVNDSRGLCPTGWHVPTIAEWNTLSIKLDPTQSLAGEYMKSARITSAGTPIWSSGSATNRSGFTGLPGGKLDGAVFTSMGEQGFWWTSTSREPEAQDPAAPIAVFLGSSLSYISADFSVKAAGMSVRCIRD
jgi:uncharacterized protein (TIGR02145 family)